MQEKSKIKFILLFCCLFTCIFHHFNLSLFTTKYKFVKIILKVESIFIVKIIIINKKERRITYGKY